MRNWILDMPAERRQGHHPGLTLQRYMNLPATGSTQDATERRQLLDCVIGAARSERLHAVYDAAYSRWNESFSPSPLHLTQELHTGGRLIIGLGSSGVLETGLRLHHTYGVPLIPGSALKGVASHYCHEAWGQRHLESVGEGHRQFRRGEKAHSLLFGTTSDGGVITFHDAWITPRSLGEGALHMDVMTPHHPDWQAKGVPPTDIDSPTPIPFLSVSGAFQVRLSWSGPIETPAERAQAWTQLAMGLLQEALAEWGVGGKTSSGYGRLLAATVAPVTGHLQAIPRPGERVEAALLEEKTKRGGWRARHGATGLDGPIQNSTDVPAGKAPGDLLVLVVASSSQREIAFRYPTGTDEGRAGHSRDRPKGAPRG